MVAAGDCNAEATLYEAAQRARTPETWAASLEAGASTLGLKPMFLEQLEEIRSVHLRFSRSPRNIALGATHEIFDVGSFKPFDDRRLRIAIS